MILELTPLPNSNKAFLHSKGYSNPTRIYLYPMLKQFLRGPLNSKCKMCSISYTKISKQGEQVVTNIKK